MQNMTTAQKSAHTRKVRAKLATIDAKAAAKARRTGVITYNPSRLDTFDRLRKLCPIGGTVYVSCDHVSRSGMSRKINAHVITGRGKSADLQYIAGLMALAFPDTFTRRAGDDALTVGGCGMDMGFATVYNLAQCLYGDGYALTHQWV